MAQTQSETRQVVQGLVKARPAMALRSQEAIRLIRKIGDGASYGQPTRRKC